MERFVCAKASHQDTHLCGILFDEPATLSKLACEMEKASHQDTHLCGILFDEPASSSRGIKSSLLDFDESASSSRGSYPPTTTRLQVNRSINLVSGALFAPYSEGLLRRILSAARTERTFPEIILFTAAVSSR